MHHASKAYARLRKGLLIGLTLIRIRTPARMLPEPNRHFMEELISRGNADGYKGPSGVREYVLTD